MVVKSGLVFCVLIPLFLAQKGYYWRFYTGDVPPDAFEPGRDDNNEAIYVGMALPAGWTWTLLPGTIYPRQKKFYYEFGLKEHNTDSDVLILCAEHKEQFQWGKTQKDRKVSEITQHNELQMVYAGSDRSFPLYVGRMRNLRNQTVVGKVLVVNDVFDYMWVAKGGEGWTVTNYEVLLYNPGFVVRKDCLGKNITINVYND